MTEQEKLLRDQVEDLQEQLLKKENEISFLEGKVSALNRILDKAIIAFGEYIELRRAKK